jgi:TolB protein
MSDTLITGQSTTGAFDRVAWLVMAAVVVIIALVIWRGDQVGLEVVTMVPAPDTLNISPRAQVRIRFDQPLDTASVQPGTLVLSPAITGAVRAEGDTLVFVPAQPLHPDTAYTVELAPGVQSVQGRRLHDALRWHFTTGHTSIVYSQLDSDRHEQLMVAAVEFPANGEVRLAAPVQVTSGDSGIWDFGVDENTGQIVYSQLHDDGTSDLWTLLPGAQAPALLQSCPKAACSGVAFSPDSKLLAYAQRNASDFGSPVVSPPRLYLLELAKGTSAPVFADNQQLAFDPRWSPDGKWLSYLAPDLGGIGAYNLEDGTTRFYPTTTGETAVWNPQRNEFVMSEMVADSPDFEVHLILIDPVTETRQNLSLYEQPVEDNTPAFSPDGEWIAFRRKELEGPHASPGKQLWLMRADGSDERPLTQAPEYDHGPVTWSPDGRYLLYHRYALRGPDVTISVWMMDVTNGQSREVARPGQRPQWAP